MRIDWLSRSAIVAVWFLSGSCSSDETTDKGPLTPQIDAGTSAGDDGGGGGGPVGWTNAEKCENMCQSYCVHRYGCDGTPITDCRMMIDHADGGTCEERAGLFKAIPQSQVQACIDDINAMSCTDFEHMFNTGEGVPDPCIGILA